MERRSQGPALPGRAAAALSLPPPLLPAKEFSLSPRKGESQPGKFHYGAGIWICFPFPAAGCSQRPLFYHMWFAERCPVTRALCQDLGTAQRGLGLKQPPAGIGEQVWGSEGERRGLILRHPLKLSGALCSLRRSAASPCQVKRGSRLIVLVTFQTHWQQKQLQDHSLEGFYQNKQKNLNPNPFSNTENVWRKGTSAPEPCLASQQREDSLLSCTGEGNENH